MHDFMKYPVATQLADWINASLCRDTSIPGRWVYIVHMIDWKNIFYDSIIIIRTFTLSSKYQWLLTSTFIIKKKNRKRNRITKEIQYEILKKFIWLSGYHEICTFILSIAPESKWSDKNWQCSPAVHKAHANLIVFHIDFFTLNKTLPWKWRKCPWRDPQFSLAVVTLILMAVHVRPVLWFLSLCECGIYCEDKRFRNQHHFPLN